MVKDEKDVMHGAIAGPLLTTSLLHLCHCTGIAEQHCIGAAVPSINKAERRNGWPESCEVKYVVENFVEELGDILYVEDAEDVEDGTSRTRSNAKHPEDAEGTGRDERNVQELTARTLGPQRADGT